MSRVRASFARARQVALEHPFALGLVALGLFAGAAQLYATHWGIGLSPDSAQYVAGARSIAQGKGLTFPDGDGTPIPITLWPPMYSAILAVPALFGLDPVISARWVNCLVFVGLVVVSGLIVGRMAGKLRYAALAAAFLVLASQEVQSIHAWAWSEPTFLFFGLLSLYAVDRFIGNGQARWLVAASLSGAFSFMARYPGAAFLAAGIGGILVSGSWNKKAKVLRYSGLYAAIGVSGGLGWLARTYALSGQTAGRQFQFGGISSPELASLYQQVSLWLVPGRITGPARNLVFAGMILAFACALVFGRASGRNQVEVASGRPSRLFPMLLLFLASYTAAVVLARWWILPRFPLDDMRYWVADFVALVLLGAGSAHFVYEGVLALAGKSPGVMRRRAKALLSLIAGLTFAYFGLLEGAHGWAWIVHANRAGLGYNSTSWHQSRMIDFVRELPPDTVLYSNGYDAINVLTKRPAYASPASLHATPTRTENQYNADLAKMVENMKQGNGYFIYFSGITWRRLATDSVLQEDMPLEKVLSNSEGTVYRVPPVTK